MKKLKFDSSFIKKIQKKNKKKKFKNPIKKNTKKISY